MMLRKISLLIYSVFFTINLFAAPSADNESSSILLGGGNESKYAEIFTFKDLYCQVYTSL